MIVICQKRYLVVERTRICCQFFSRLLSSPSTLTCPTATMESLQPLDPGLTDASILAGLHANSPPSEPDSRAAVNAIAAQFHSNPDVDDEWVEESPSTARPTSADEKRTRQRELNRQAADKSRRKRRAEL